MRNMVETKLYTLFRKVIFWPDRFLSVSSVWFKDGLIFVPEN